jgi:uncharacterized protein
MNEIAREPDLAMAQKVKIVDCDIHPALTSRDELVKYLPARWQEHARDFGMRTASPTNGAMPYPRISPGNGMRRDSWPPNGGPPASDLGFLQEQLLDGLGIDYGILQALGPGSSTFNQDLGAALAAGLNDWQIDKWLDHEPRLKGSIVVTQEDPAAAIAEIEARVKDKRFVQLALPPRMLEPAGRKRYWPIYEVAEAYDLPISMHSAAYGSRANTGTGWTSFYLEEHFAFSNAAQTAMTSMIFEGVFERFRNLKLVLVEGGFGWLPPLAWRMDREWERMREEVPHVLRRPSEQVREHVWLTTQPMEEPEVNRHLYDVLSWIGQDRLMFSTDYPHWDFDHPEYAFKVPLEPALKHAIMAGNACALYGLS